MVSANQLRIGNYIFISILQKDGSFKNELFTVNSTVIRDAEHYGNEWNAEPIPLTEEWLVKFGFKYQDRDVSHGKRHMERFYISPYFGEHRDFNLELQTAENLLKTPFAWLMWDIGGGRNFIHLPCGHKLEYVHQLQNLYFALTGSELQIK